jgi:pimeloyl-ACP methyl ester carboxylesterase
MRTLSILLLAACSSTEELVLPEDPGEPGVPVGVQTHEGPDGSLIEVWYPASDKSDGSVDEVDLTEFVPDAFAQRLPQLQPPAFATRAVRDAAFRELTDPVPLILFSHGFGGFRTQSADLTSHLASRGYVVASVDHPGRMLTDLLPCLLSPPAGTCDLFASASDPGPPGMVGILDWLETQDDLRARVDLDALGVFGHSAGGQSVTAFANDQDRVTAVLGMAGAGPLARAMPSAILGGGCDAVVQESQLVSNASTYADGYWSLADAGHLAFSDLCDLGLTELAEELAASDEANPAFVGLATSLATDGCPGAVSDTSLETCDGPFMAPERYRPLVREMVTRFFDQALRGEGDGLRGGTWDDVTQRVGE